MELKSVEDTSWLQLFIKTQHCANTKVDVYGVTLYVLLRVSSVLCF